MAAVAAPSPFNPSVSRPRVSSPLAAAVQPRPQAARTHSFPTSRPLRPFPSIAHATFKPPPAPSASAPAPKPKTGAVKLIEPPKDFKKPFFVLNLTQAEVSRQC